MSCAVKKHWILWLLLALAAAGAAVCPSPAQAAGLLVADGGFGGRQIKQQDVRVTINNGVAVTEVEQVFINKEQRIVEALYTFPVPKEASISNFSMWINGQEMIGEVVEKEQPGKSMKATSRRAATQACSSRSITSGSKCAFFRSPPAPNSASASPTIKNSISTTIRPATSILWRLSRWRMPKKTRPVGFRCRWT